MIALVVLFSTLSIVGFDKCKEETKKIYKKTWFWITLTITIILFLGSFITKSKYTKYITAYTKHIENM